MKISLFKPFVHHRALEATTSKKPNTAEEVPLEKSVPFVLPGYFHFDNSNNLFCFL